MLHSDPATAEEKLVELNDVVPFLTEIELVGRGGKYSKHDEPWKPYVVDDDRLITGQNPASTALLAEAVLKKLNGS
ncbi:hypothetical protein BGP81_06830 [Pseudomonas putida]|nr:hypothetical protein BGP81_06830 [Pseudomonas putida]